MRKRQLGWKTKKSFLYSSSTLSRPINLKLFYINILLQINILARIHSILFSRGEQLRKKAREEISNQLSSRSLDYCTGISIYSNLFGVSNSRTFGTIFTFVSRSRETSTWKWGADIQTFNGTPVFPVNVLRFNTSNNKVSEVKHRENGILSVIWYFGRQMGVFVIGEKFLQEKMFRPLSCKVIKTQPFKYSRTNKR